MSDSLTGLALDELREAWPALSDEERAQGFSMLGAEDAEELIQHLDAREALDLINALPDEETRKRWLAVLPPDDIADIVQEAPEHAQQDLLNLLDAEARAEAAGLLAYDEEHAGGLMTPRYVRLRVDMTIGQAIDFLRHEHETAELIYYAYAVDEEDRLLGVVSFRELVLSPPGKRVRDIMTTAVVTVLDTMDQEEVSRVFAREDLYCLPVVDAEGHMKGIVTADDIVDVVEEEATEDMQKLGGSSALDAPYLQSRLRELIQKRVGWLILLLVLGFVTVDLMSRYQQQMSTLADLALLGFFVPLIISCGGNSGSQASTLVVRAMALGEVSLRDWWRVFRREVLVGLGLGVLMGIVGLGAAMVWNLLTHRLGDEHVRIASAVAAGIVCVALWGTLAGATLPFLLRRVNADPASASAPLVATIVDATGLVLYFTVAGTIVRHWPG